LNFQQMGGYIDKLSADDEKVDGLGIPKLPYSGIVTTTLVCDWLMLNENNHQVDSDLVE